MKNKSLIIILLIVITIGAGGMYLLRSSEDARSATDNMATFAVKRGPLTISVIESGTIKALDMEVLKCELEGRTSILSLVPEGTHAKKGDLLVELDSSGLLDGKIDQEIRVQNTEASFIRARESLAVAKNRSKSNVDIAKLDFEFAKQDLEKYIEGEYPNEHKKAESNIQLAKERVARSEETLKWSKRLYGEKFISQTELQGDQLTANKDKVDLEIAENNLSLLEDYTKKRRIAQLESDVSQRLVDLEIAEREAISDVVQAEADLRAKESEYKRQQTKLTKIEEQLTKTKIYAPSDGLVIYATSAKGSWRGNREPLDEGSEVREREELIYLPITSASKAEVQIHESSLDKIHLGQPVTVTVDAIDGKAFSGRVVKIAPLPDPQRMWMNPDLKIYNTEVNLDSNDDSLRTGMSCMAEIVIEQYQDVLYIPVQAVVKVKGKTTVYVVSDKKVEPVKVETGLDNNRMIRIVSGLSEGEIVLLTPPLAASEVVEEDKANVNPGSPAGGEEQKAGQRGRDEQGQRQGRPAGGMEQRAGQGNRDRQGQRRDGTQRQGRPNRTKKDAGKQSGFDMNSLTEEQKAKMKEMKEKFDKMSPQEKEDMQKQRMDRKKIQDQKVK